MKIQPLHRAKRAVRTAILSLLALAGLLCLPALAATPNVIVIVADDLAWFDLAVNGATDVATPNLDALARNGVNFRNAYVTAPICSPSRAGLMTGRYQQRFGHETNPGPDLETNPIFGLPANEVTIAERFKAFNPNYATGWVGKSHLGWNLPAQPNTIGFDHFLGFLQSHHHYLNANRDPQEFDNGAPRPADNSDWIQRNGTPLTKNPGVPFPNAALTLPNPALALPYLTYLFSDEIGSFIDRSATASRPFFLYAPFNAVHFDLEAPIDLVQRFNAANPALAVPVHPGPLIPVMTNALVLPAPPPPEITQRQKLQVVLFGLDEAIGRLLDKLANTRVGGRPLLDDTLIIFTSDNGGDTYFGGNNGPLRGRKTQVYEGGIRVPFLMYWKGRLAPATLKAPVSTLDIMPTVLAAIGAPVPANLDGVNLLPYIQNPAGPQPHDRLFWRIETNGINASDDAPDGLRAMRKGDWKLVKPSASQTWELYNLAEAENESINRADTDPTILYQMITEWNAWSAQMARPRWAWNQLLYPDPAFILEDVRVGSTTTSYLATDFLSSAGRFAFQDGTNALRHDAINLANGFPAQAPVLVDTGLTPLTNPLVGPQWGLAAGSSSLFYTKPGAGGRSQIWRAMPGAPAALTTTTTVDSFGPRASRDLTDSAPQVAFMAGTTASWANIAPPRSVNTIPLHSGGADNGRWIPDSADLAYAGTPPGAATPQIARLRTATNTPVQISNDAGAKSSVWAFRAPELGGALCYAAVVRETGLPDVIGIYADVPGTPGSFFQRVASLRIPPPEPNAPPRPTVYFHSMRPIDGLRGFNGVSYFTCVVSANPNPAVPGESQVWLFGLGPDATNRVARRIDGGVGARFAPQTVVGTTDVFAYYTRTNGIDPAQLRLAATGLGKPVFPTAGGFPALQYEWSFVAGTAAAFNGTETTHLVPHGGKLYAGQGSLGNRANLGTNRWTGAQLLVKDSPAAAWRVDRDFTDHLRVEAMDELVFTTRDGVQLGTPARVIVAAMSDITAIGSRTVSVRTRDDLASPPAGPGVWNDSHPANPTNVAAFPTAFGAHRVGDATTGIHFAFAGISSGEIHRGIYSQPAPGAANLVWQTPTSEPGVNGGPVTGFAEANGLLYAATALKLNGAQLEGGLFVRNDSNSSWQRVHRWTPPVAINSAPVAQRALTGLTAVPDPRNSGRQVLVGALSWPGTIVRIDPASAHAMTVELDVRDFFARRWNDDSVRTAAVTIGYTRFTPATLPNTGELVHLIGVWIEHPDSPRRPHNGSHYLIRHADGTYEAADIEGLVPAVPNNQSLRATRAIAVSPFSADANRVFYFGGYDADGDSARNTAWIVRSR